ncbi:MAG TPA: hypothetical protein VGN86_09300 [Pyrinomonadaceae bacterium]|nr:hypothetical protein [Pyrinomonadaceae bacterium]
MATPAQVAPFFFAQLNNDNHPATVSAGPNWPLFPLGFFYGDEISVDLAMKNIMLRILAMEHATLPAPLWGNLSSMIGRATIVKDAIVTIAQISTGAIHG